MNRDKKLLWICGTSLVLLIGIYAYAAYVYYVYKQNSTTINSLASNPLVKLFGG